MKVGCRGFGYSLLVLLTCSIVGCGGGEKPVLVSGMVTLDGDPLEGATVRFYNPETERNFSGRTDPNGEYRLRAVPGDYKVGISKQEGETKDVMTDEEMAVELMKEFEENPTTEPPKGETIPARFSDIAQTELKFTVPPGGTDTADFMTLVSE